MHGPTELFVDNFRIPLLARPILAVDPGAVMVSTAADSEHTATVAGQWAVHLVHAPYRIDADPKRRSIRAITPHTEPIVHRPRAP
ncbi:hypothetical protein ACL02S_01820 [Nocardia sp. 004]|uniref:hypothetical protein n=1 Tax=Nocardia sp. 004 TaxID=3385978 RepID=UPI0039A38F2A